MNFFKSDIEKWTQLKAEIVVEEELPVMIARFTGIYRRGSEGNPDGNFMFAKLNEHASIWDPACIILDLRELEYTFGNTLLNSLRFFAVTNKLEADQLLVIVVVSSKCREAIEGLLGAFVKNHPIDLLEDMDEALKRAEKMIKEYLDIEE